MAEALLFGEKEAQILAAKEIEKLNSRQKQKLAEKGVISPLVLMLHNQDYESIEAALFALLNLAFGMNKLRIAKAGAIPAILKILQQCRNATLMDLPLAALLILSSCSANKLEIASSGAVQLLFQLLDTRFNISPSISNQAMLDILSTLHNLSTCPRIIPSILISGGLIALVRLIRDAGKSSELVEKAMVLLECIVDSSEVALHQVCESPMVIPMLVEAVEEGSAACQQHAVGILLSICRSCRERYRGLILNEGAMAGLLQLSVDGTWIARDKAKALILLLRDSGHGVSSSSSSRDRCPKNVELEEVMRQIDREERGGNCIKIVEEMIAKLRT
ncbi:hypothetical protein OROMI_000432 [Orobanche minor]